MIRFDTVLRALVILAFACGVARAGSDPVKIVALGDSLTAGYQLAPEAAFPVQLEAALKARGHNVEVVNAGVSGDTSSGGLARLDWSVGEAADAVIVELGANDALRGVPVASVRENIDAIVARLDERGLPVLVAGMRAPRNMGEDYAAAFDAIFPEVAEKHGALLYPYFLEGVPVSRETVLPDGMHPTQKGVALIVEGILPDVEALIERARAGSR
ncbi:GDSL-type esterase/lipase family protein [Stappia stellulata]|uniref:arylesterase n=1 Tax=Stappia stellulata TaxID=71235 RepID=UPI00048D67C6